MSEPTPPLPFEFLTGGKHCHRSVVMMLDFGDKAKNPSFATSKLVSTLTAKCLGKAHRIAGCPGPAHTPDALPRTPGRCADPERPLFDPRVLQNDQPVHRPGHAQQDEVQPEAGPRRPVRGRRALQGLGRLARFCVGPRKVLGAFRADVRRD